MTHVRGWLTRPATITCTTAVAGLVLYAPAAEAATCKASMCNGKNPQSYGCARDAKTVSDALSLRGHSVELRYSKKCKAIWVRGEKYPQVKIQAGFIDYYGHWKTQKSYNGPNKQGWFTNDEPYLSPGAMTRSVERLRSDRRNALVSRRSISTAAPPVAPNDSENPRLSHVDD